MDDGNGHAVAAGDDDRRRHKEDRRDRSRSRSRDRKRRDDDRHKSSRHRSRSKERSRRSRSRSRSRTPPRRRRRPTQWDVLPEGGVVPNLAAVPPSQVPGMIPAFPPAPAVPDMANIAASMGLAVPGIGAAGMAAAAAAALGSMGLPVAAGAGAGSTAHSQQATRHARRVYVGGLPPTAGEQSVSTFFSHALAAVGGNTAGPGQSVVNVYINKDKNFAFVEFRTAICCT